MKSIATSSIKNSNILLDGSHGEGGGQILRSALTLSMLTGRSFQIENIRVKRPKPGLMRQHLTAVEAAATICGATLDEAVLGSTRLAFTPGKVKAGKYHFAIGTAGSTCLVLQTVWLPLALLAKPSTLTLDGGTHNPHAPAYPFLEAVFLPLIRLMGYQMELELIQPGFYPAGGGRIVATISPAKEYQPLVLPDRGAQLDRHATAILGNLPDKIGEKEIAVLIKLLNLRAEECSIEKHPVTKGAGNALTMALRYEHITECFTTFGEWRVPSEQVAKQLADEVKYYLKTTAPVGQYLADQLLLPMLFAAGGTYRTARTTPHFHSNVYVIKQFLGNCVTQQSQKNGTEIRVIPQS